jgi:hypothetical protein
MFPQSESYTEANIHSAISAVRTFTASMGGTDILSPLADCLRTPPNSRYPRLVFLVTDGAVSNIAQITALVQRERLTSRVSAVGIGTGASQQLIQQVARAGQGSSTLILGHSQIKEGILRALEQTLQPCLCDITVDWLGQTPVCVHPSKPFFAFYGGRISFNAVLKGDPTAFRLSYIDLDSQAKSLEFPIDLTQVTEGRSALVQAVRGAIGTPEEVSLAVEFNVLTTDTSLIAVNYQSATALGSSQLYKVSLHPRSTGQPRGSVVQINGRYVRLNQVTMSKTGKHGSSKALVTAVDLETGKAFQTVLLSSELPTLSPRPTPRPEPAQDLVVLTDSSDAPHSSPQPLEFLQLQSPNGSWTLTTELEAALVPHLPCVVSRVFEAYPALSPAVVVTMLVLALLHEKFMSAEGTWRLLAVKGIRWLKKQGVVPASYAELTRTE